MVKTSGKREENLNGPRSSEPGKKNEGIGAYMPALSGRETPWAPFIPLAAIVGKIAGGWCKGVVGPSCFAQLRYINGSNEGRLVTSDPNGPISVHTLTDRTVVGKFPVRPLGFRILIVDQVCGVCVSLLCHKKNSQCEDRRESKHLIFLSCHRRTTPHGCTSLIHMTHSIICMMFNFVVNMAIAIVECGPRRAPSKGLKISPDRIAT